MIPSHRSVFSFILKDAINIQMYTTDKKDNLTLLLQLPKVFLLMSIDKSIVFSSVTFIPTACIIFPHDLLIREVTVWGWSLLTDAPS